MMHTEAGTYTVCIVQPMHSSTGYGLTTSNPCMGVIKRVADDEVLQLFFFYTGTFPALCPCGEHAPGRDAAAAAERRPPPGGARQPRTVRLAATPGRGAVARERQRREGAARPAASSASGGGPSVSLDHFPALGKMNHGSAAAGPRPHYRFALSFHIGT